MAEAVAYYQTIKDSLCQNPFSCSLIMLSIIDSDEDTLSRLKTQFLPQNYEQYGLDLVLCDQDPLDERLLTLKMACNNFTDDLLSEFVQYVGSDTLI